MSEPVDLQQIKLCFEGAVPAVIATAAADGTPNVTYLSRVLAVDNERIALSNQFFSKTARNLAENPRASVLVIDPTTYLEYRLRLVYERTERRGPVFDRLREDIAALAALTGMEGVFRLRAADIYRVDHLERVKRAGIVDDGEPPPTPRSDGLDPHRTAALAEMAARLARSSDLDSLLTAATDGLADLLGYDHSLLLLLDEEGGRLYTIASRGYDAEGMGSEVVVGEGLIGLAAARCRPLRVGNLGQMAKYSTRVRRSFEGAGEIEPGPSLPVPGLADAQSQVAVPAMALGQLQGVLLVESRELVAFTDADEAVLGVVAGLVATAVEAARSDERAATAPAPSAGSPVPDAPPSGAGPVLRFFAVDGSTFLDGDYLIKGVAGRLLWSLVGQHARDGRTDFTNREVRLDPTLELPPFRDNFESRLILLKRRLDEHEAPVRIERSGRGRFRLLVDAPLQLELGGEPPA
jgi:adenylate cyclase